MKRLAEMLIHLRQIISYAINHPEKRRKYGKATNNTYLTRSFKVISSSLLDAILLREDESWKWVQRSMTM